MPRVRRRSARRFQFDAFDVLIGPEMAGRFGSEAEWERCVSAMRDWYAVNGPDFEREHFYAGARSWAWWRFIRAEDPPSPRDEVERLRELGELTPEEELELVRKSNQKEVVDG